MGGRHVVQQEKLSPRAPVPDPDARVLHEQPVVLFALSQGLQGDAAGQGSEGKSRWQGSFSGQPGLSARKKHSSQ